MYICIMYFVIAIKIINSYQLSHNNLHANSSIVELIRQSYHLRKITIVEYNAMYCIINIMIIPSYLLDTFLMIF